jgi:hypothetical protein
MNAVVPREPVVKTTPRFNWIFPAEVQVEEAPLKVSKRKTDFLVWAMILIGILAGAFAVLGEILEQQSRHYSLPGLF